jgi:hypothetical protein
LTVRDYVVKKLADSLIPRLFRMAALTTIVGHDEVFLQLFDGSDSLVDVRESAWADRPNVKVTFSRDWANVEGGIWSREFGNGVPCTPAARHCVGAINEVEERRRATLRIKNGATSW